MGRGGIGCTSLSPLRRPPGSWGSPKSPCGMRSAGTRLLAARSGGATTSRASPLKATGPGTIRGDARSRVSASTPACRSDVMAEDRQEEPMEPNRVGADGRCEYRYEGFLIFTPEPVTRRVLDTAIEALHARLQEEEAEAQAGKNRRTGRGLSAELRPGDVLEIAVPIDEVPAGAYILVSRE